MNRSCFSFRALSRTPRNPWDTRSPRCVGCVLGSMSFSLVTGLSSPSSASHVSIAFVQWVRRYYADVRLLTAVHTRIALLASRADPAAGWPRIPVRSLGSRACSFSTCVRLLDYAGPVLDAVLAMSSPTVLRSRCKHTVCARIAFFEAHFLARRCLCLRFTWPLTAPGARLKVKMVRYSFLVGLFHPRLHAGLSRRLRRGRDGRFRPPPAQTRTCGSYRIRFLPWI